MKKFFLLLLLTILVSHNLLLYANKTRIDIGVITYKPAQLDLAAGGNFALGFATRDIDFMLGGRYLQYDLGRVRPYDISHAYLRTDVKFHLPNNPLTLLLGIGLGAARAIITVPSEDQPNELKQKIRGGPLGELSFATMYPMSQTISLMGRLMWLYNNFPINELTSRDASGLGLEIGVRFSFEPTRELSY